MSVCGVTPRRHISWVHRHYSSFKLTIQQANIEMQMNSYYRHNGGRESPIIRTILPLNQCLHLNQIEVEPIGVYARWSSHAP